MRGGLHWGGWRKPGRRASCRSPRQGDVQRVRAEQGGAGAASRAPFASWAHGVKGAPTCPEAGRLAPQPEAEKCWGGGAPSLCPQCPGLASGGAGERQWGPDRAVPQAPDWVDAEECHRCRVQFGVVTRKVSVPVGSGGLPPPPSQPHVAPSLLVVVGDREGIPPRPHGGRGHQGLVPACCCQVPLTLPRPGAPRLGAEARASKPAGVSPPRAGGDGRRQTHQAPPARLTPFL